MQDNIQQALENCVKLEKIENDAGGPSRALFLALHALTYLCVLQEADNDTCGATPPCSGASGLSWHLQAASQGFEEEDVVEKSQGLESMFVPLVLGLCAWESICNCDRGLPPRRPGAMSVLSTRCAVAVDVLSNFIRAGARSLHVGLLCRPDEALGPLHRTDNHRGDRHRHSGPKWDLRQQRRLGFASLRDHIP